jgi:hypothetical protein
LRSLAIDAAMIDKDKESWLKLCEQAANEQNPEKLMHLVAEITRLLEEKEQRLKVTAVDGKSA